MCSVRHTRRQQDAIDRNAQGLSRLSSGDTAQPKGDDVVRFNARLAQGAKKREREVLVEEDLHDALRTAGAWWAAMWAA